VALLVALAAAIALPAGARTTPGPTVDIQSSAGLAPDGRFMGVAVSASCPERWTVVEAVIAVAQPQASGQASFPLTCDGGRRVFHVAVPASSGTFDLGDAQVTARVVIKRGKTASAQDSELVDPDPLVSVVIAETAQLTSGGDAATIDVTVACPIGTTGLESRINISQQGRTSANGTYTPICDGSPHTFNVTIAGTFQPGSAVALTFADVEYEGEIFFGVDDGPIELVA
jgi:hypothetical protein